MGEGNKLPHNAPVEDVHIRVRCVQIQRVILRGALPGFEQAGNALFQRVDGICRPVEGVLYFIGEIEGAVFLVGEQPAARKPARPAVLVVQPDAQSLFFRLVQADTHAAEPLLREVFRFQSRTRMKDESAQRKALHLADLTAQLPLFKGGVDAPEHDGPICGERFRGDIQTSFSAHACSSMMSLMPSGTCASVCTRPSLTRHSKESSPSGVGSVALT